MIIFGLGKTGIASQVSNRALMTTSHSHRPPRYASTFEHALPFNQLTLLAEFQIPPQVARYASFMFSFLSRGVFYLFIGCIIIDKSWWKATTGSLIALIGVAYVALEFVPSIEPPANMR